MSDSELKDYCQKTFGKSSFTGNDIILNLKYNNNSIHFQLLRMFKKNLLVRFVKRTTTYYNLK